MNRSVLEQDVTMYSGGMYIFRCKQHIQGSVGDGITNPKFRLVRNIFIYALNDISLNTMSQKCNL